MIRKYQRAYVRQALGELYKQYKVYRKATTAAGEKAKTLRQWLRLDPN